MWSFQKQTLYPCFSELLSSQEQSLSLVHRTSDDSVFTFASFSIHFLIDFSEYEAHTGGKPYHRTTGRVMIESFQRKQGFSPTQILTRFIAQRHLTLFSNPSFFSFCGIKISTWIWGWKFHHILLTFICMCPNTFYEKKSSKTVPQCF